MQDVVDLRYRLSMVVGLLNIVNRAMRELEAGSGVVWGDALPRFRNASSVVEEDQREMAEFSVTRTETAERETTASLMGRSGPPRW